MVLVSSESEKVVAPIEMKQDSMEQFTLNMCPESEIEDKGIRSFLAFYFSGRQGPEFIFLFLWCISTYLQIQYMTSFDVLSVCSSGLLFSCLYFFYHELFFHRTAVSYVKLVIFFSIAVVILILWVPPTAGIIAAVSLLFSTIWFTYKHELNCLDLKERYQQPQQDFDPTSTKDKGSVDNCSDIHNIESPQKSHDKQLQFEIERLLKERDEAKNSLFTTRQELAKAYIRVRELESSVSTMSPTTSQSVNTQNVESCNSGVISDTFKEHDRQHEENKQFTEASRDIHIARSRYHQLQEQFQEQRLTLDETRRELFIVQGRELALSQKMQESDTVACYTSLHEIAQALDSTQKNHEYDTAEEGVYLEGVIDSYEDIINYLLQENEELKRTSGKTLKNST